MKSTTASIYSSNGELNTPVLESSLKEIIPGLVTITGPQNRVYVNFKLDNGDLLNICKIKPSTFAFKVEIIKPDSDLSYTSQSTLKNIKAVINTIIKEAKEDYNKKVVKQEKKEEIHIWDNDQNLIFSNLIKVLKDRYPLYEISFTTKKSDHHEVLWAYIGDSEGNEIAAISGNISLKSDIINPIYVRDGNKKKYLNQVTTFKLSKVIDFIDSLLVKVKN
jgi:hypothetical protein